jgi:glycosyltransferase involved in cell wall biosynthesis
MQKNSAPKVLVLSRNYPNSVTPILGLWVKGLVSHLAPLCEIKVIAPTPYCPPLPGLKGFTRFRSIERSLQVDGVEVFHPRFLTGPGYTTYNIESSLYYWSIRHYIDRLRKKFPFDLIHANFGYPDGVVAAKLADRYKVPFVITEHASWTPWMDDYPKVHRQAVWAAERSAFHIAVSRFARQTIAYYTGESKKLRIVPNGVDVDVFTPRTNGDRMDPNQILYVGFMRHVKGVDVLLQAMQQLVKRNPKLKLVLVGGGIYRHSQAQESDLHAMARELGIENNVSFVGIKTPAEVASYMRQSAVLVLPSRTETFGAVLVEALACGTPVVATTCGGTVDIVDDSVGRLVPKENAKELAKAILDIVSERSKFDPKKLRDYAVNNFGWEQIARRTVDLYSEALKNGNH